MGLLDLFRGGTPAVKATTDLVLPPDAAQRVLPDPYEPFLGHFHSSSGIPVADPGVPLAELQRGKVEEFWRSQSNVRKVVDFIARNVASIPLHVFERVSDTDRQRLGKPDPLAWTVAAPSLRQAPYRFWHGVLSDGLLHDRWACMKVPSTVHPGLDLVHVPSWRLRLSTDALNRVVRAWFWVGDQPRQEQDFDGWRPLDLDGLVFDHGYAPRTAGLSPVETLRSTLEETAEAVAYRQQVWARGARAQGAFVRPADAPPWSPEARQRWAAGMKAQYTGNGPEAGGMPLLEDGITPVEMPTFKPRDAMDLEGRRLSAIEVAAAFHIAPELVGAQQGNYSNVREYRQMLYRDSLGPYISAWEGALQAQLVPDLAGGRDVYVEAHVESKLRGSFEEQASVKQSAVGGPWLTINESRALENRAPVDGGDVVARPLNMLYGSSTTTPGETGTASRQPAGKTRTVRVKARATPAVAEQARDVLAAFFDRQGRTVASRAGAGDDLWDADRWDAELADELMAVNVLVATTAGRATLAGLGFDADGWDEGRTLAWLRENADGVATGVNEATRAQVQDAVDADEDGDPGAAVAALFAGVVAQRVVALSDSQVSAVSGFGTSEAVSQAGVEAVKTWRVRSQRPRSSHRFLDGTTVGMGETFANGARWPGDSLLDPDERAGCTCDIDVTVQEG